ncbi:CD99 molecule isoform X2 [Clarias gariepinus]|uniref:CD99 molecule isoform X2 n=1 Tax=Clarias gariepinus TaxID=13013 RepID=UPI00234DFAB8|nr:CD99 molecule isoform X2 [Clarias gariepinus]
MTSYMWILLFAALALTKAQELDLGDAIGNLDDPTVKPPVKKPPKESDGGFDLSDAFGDSDEPKPADPKKPVAPPKTDGGFDLSDAFGDSDEPKPADPKKPVAPPKTGGGDFGDSDLSDAAGDGYKPDPGHGGRSGGNAGDYTDTQGDQSQVEGGQMAGIISAVAVAIFGAASSYFAYQKKKLCFKMQGGTDPESGRNQSGAQSDPQAFSNLLRSS